MPEQAGLVLTVFWAQADNGGGALIGSNYPYKGGKTNFYEGGIRAVAFVWSELLPAAVRGVPITALVHVRELPPNSSNPLAVIVDVASARSAVAQSLLLRGVCAGL